MIVELVDGDFEVRRFTNTEERSAADTLRRLADWLDEHDDIVPIFLEVRAGGDDWHVSLLSDSC